MSAQEIYDVSQSDNQGLLIIFIVAGVIVALVIMYGFFTHQFKPAIIVAGIGFFALGGTFVYTQANPPVTGYEKAAQVIAEEVAKQGYEVQADTITRSQVDDLVNGAGSIQVMYQEKDAQAPAIVYFNEQDTLVVLDYEKLLSGDVPPELQ